MHIRITTDPITQQEVTNPEQHPCVYEGDGVDGLEIYFENEQTRDEFLLWKQNQDGRIALKGDTSDDYVAEG
ncbi:MAG: hypothetical protein EP315_05775 [Gammaproteobacteria bacterium]|nr:MAG: hypothetical protein EP315_05775 [Gammaproteobacteria bacterium]